jgi:alkanesulfonate monooxygenase SsuD/methylene tetrahydromethanopterin reductase-like flavin-dependent oxidoreductase (luciferase family)
MRGIDVTHHDTRPMVYESIDVILKYWESTEPFDFEGRYWSGKNVRVLPKPFQQPHPPIAAACTGSPETIDLAAKHGFIPLFGRGGDMAQDIKQAGNLYVESARAAGRTPSRRDFHVAHIVYVGETDEQARNDARAGLTSYLETGKREPLHFQKRIPQGGTMDDVTYEYMMDTGYYWVGSPDTVYQRIKDYYDESGGFGVLLIGAAIPLATPEKVAGSLRLFMEEVAPRLAGLEPDYVAA